jgi:hypothetical protein
MRDQESLAIVCSAAFLVLAPGFVRIADTKRERRAETGGVLLCAARESNRNGLCQIRLPQYLNQGCFCAQPGKLNATPLGFLELKD